MEVAPLPLRILRSEIADEQTRARKVPKNRPRKAETPGARLVQDQVCAASAKPASFDIAGDDHQLTKEMRQRDAPRGPAYVPVGPPAPDLAHPARKRQSIIDDLVDKAPTKGTFHNCLARSDSCTRTAQATVAPAKES